LEVKILRVDKLVTLGGQCFEAEFEREERAADRDGIYYFFRLKDLTGNRGELFVRIFRFGPKEMLDPNYDRRIEAVRLNAIRRALDAKTLSFDRLREPRQYQHVPLTPADFKPQPAVSEDEIRRFIKRKAYWLSFRYSPDGRYPVQFDDPVDLEYLGIDADDVIRNVYFLGEQGFLGKTTIPGMGRPNPTLIEEYEAASVKPAPLDSKGGNVIDRHSSRTVFVVHGHDEAVKQSVARFVEKLDLLPVILHEQPNKGRTVIEKFEAHSEVGFAVVLLTPDDVGSVASAPGKSQPRARQNVILELGYFIGKLSRARVCALYVEGVELPSDIHGVVYVRYDDGGAWRIGLAKEINAAGIAVDMNRI
jgi:predicted nucleotide-binding protein